MNVRMPDGTLVTDVPDDITQEELLARYEGTYQEPDPIEKADKLSDGVYQDEEGQLFKVTGGEISPYEHGTDSEG